MGLYRAVLRKIFIRFGLSAHFFLATPAGVRDELGYLSFSRTEVGPFYMPISNPWPEQRFDAMIQGKSRMS
jgi:hypothetical protein